ncbi:hypothetical protein JTB14_019734 [Gonioctena quinquepunctata]|nr:hypothetical protein JTB14_019734 [Gonioctena quinquepunctata]
MDLRDGKTVPRKGEGENRGSGEEQNHGDEGETSVPQMSQESQIQESTSMEHQIQMLMNFIARNMDGMKKNMGRFDKGMKEKMGRMEENMKKEWKNI